MSTYTTNTTEPNRTESARPSASKSTATMSDNWADFKPKNVSQEDSLSKGRNAETWAKIYAAVGATDEKAQKRVRAGVYVYCALNGTSRVGTYGGEIQLADGMVMAAAELPRAAGNEVRKFLRSNMTESYRYFKDSRVMEDYPRFVSKAAQRGVAAQDAFATADWLLDCPLFTPTEKKAHAASFAFSIQRAVRAREGKSLETVETEAANNQLEAQGKFPVGGGHAIDW